MPKPFNFANNRTYQSVFQQLSKADSGVQHTLKRLFQSVPMPLDAACLALVCKAARMTTQSALSLIPEINATGKKLLADLQALEDACAAIYKDQDAVDTLATLQGRKTLYAGWSTLAFLADTDLPLSSARLAACGLELALKLVSTDRKLVAEVHMSDLAKGSVDFDLDSNELIKGFYFEQMSLADCLPWFVRAKSNYFKLLTAFSEIPPPPPPPPTILEKAVAQWKAHSAYPNFKQRAAVLDKTTCSDLQIKHAVNSGVCPEIPERNAFMTVLWFAGFSGLNFGSLADIPLLGPECNTWVVCLEMETGLLKRDFSCLTPTMAKAGPGSNCIPTTMNASIPLPVSALYFLQQRMAILPSALTLGDLIPEMMLVKSTQHLYKTSLDIPPTWARWNRTIGRYMRREGVDNLLASIISGNFGNTAKSKVHYCAVSTDEIWTVCNEIYKKLNFGVPVEMPADLLHFGSHLVPTHEHVVKLDVANLDRLSQLKVVGKCSPEKLLEFHNQYVKALGFRICCLLALREANPVDLYADLDENSDLTVDIDDKPTPGRPGALPVPLPKHITQLIKTYRAHCSAMINRLKGKHGYSNIVQWLEHVVHRGRVPLLCKIEVVSKRALPITTAIVLELDDHIARDFGRKLMENHLRVRGVITRDTDRTMRHEVLGQEAYSSVADDSEIAWVKRVSPIIDDLATEIFPSPLNGLRNQS
jgi:hypothetical protein